MEQIKTFLDECWDGSVEEIIITGYDKEVLLGMIKKFGEDMYDGGYEAGSDNEAEKHLV